MTQMSYLHLSGQMTRIPRVHGIITNISRWWILQYYHFCAEGEKYFPLPRKSSIILRSWQKITQEEDRIVRPNDKRSNTTEINTKSSQHRLSAQNKHKKNLLSLNKNIPRAAPIADTLRAPRPTVARLVPLNNSRALILHPGHLTFAIVCLQDLPDNQRLGLIDAAGAQSSDYPTLSYPLDN